MATLNYSHFGNSGRSYLCARCTVVHKKSKTRAFLLCMVHYYINNARKCLFHPPRRAAAGSRMQAAAIFFISYMYFYIVYVLTYKFS